MKKLVKIKFQNGMTSAIALNEIFNELLDEFEFEESENPDFIFFAPYGIELPEPGNYVRIGYFCENIYPDLSICEWAFGVMPEDRINDPRYKRIQWQAIDTQTLVKSPDYNPAEILGNKKHFCNFLYSTPIAYREEFFRQLSRYKRVDAPGKSMNNMPGIDNLYEGNKWKRKQQFLAPYKFTIAFENYVYPGYQTEKLFDAMQASSIPIYCGDPFVSTIFDTDSFINTPDYIKTSDSFMINWLEKHSQLDFKDILPRYYNGPLHRVKRKLKSIGKQAKMKYQFSKLDFRPLIDRIIELDEDDNKYLELLSRPWFNKNEAPLNFSLRSRWKEIFDKA